MHFSNKQFGFFVYLFTNTYYDDIALRNNLLARVLEWIKLKEQIKKLCYIHQLLGFEVEKRQNAAGIDQTTNSLYTITLQYNHRRSKGPGGGGRTPQNFNRCTLGGPAPRPQICTKSIIILKFIYKRLRKSKKILQISS